MTVQHSVQVVAAGQPHVLPEVVGSDRAPRQDGGQPGLLGLSEAAVVEQQLAQVRFFQGIGAGPGIARQRPKQPPGGSKIGGTQLLQRLAGEAEGFRQRHLTFLQGDGHGTREDVAIKGIATSARRQAVVG